MGEELTESLCVRIKGRVGTRDIRLGVCYRPPDQEDQADKALYRETEAASYLQGLVLQSPQYLLEELYSRA